MMSLTLSTLSVFSAVQGTATEYIPFMLPKIPMVKSTQQKSDLSNLKTGGILNGTSFGYN
jgi:hypothetical protein